MAKDASLSGVRQISRLIHGGIVSMNIGEMQRTLSRKAGKVKERRFDDLYSLVCRMDWLRLAHDYVEQNAGSKTAGSDDEDMGAFNENMEANLLALRKGLQTG